MKQTLSLAILFLLFSQLGRAQEELPIFYKDSLDDYILAQQKKWDIPALAVAVVKDGKVIKQFINGVTDRTSNTPIDENTLFMIGSNSKAFTATLMATLAEEDKISLKDPVKKWLPYFKLYDPYLTEHVNIIDVLSHRVGFKTFQGDFLNFDNELTSKEIIRKFALIKPTYTYREKWGYFNTGYTIAGEIIEAATDSTWAQQLRSRIFEPLEMNRSLALTEEIHTATNRTLGHTFIDGKNVIIPYGDIDATAPAGSISSSLGDMSKWMIALLANGVYKDKQVIPAKAIAATRTPHTIMGSADYPFYFYGLGWFVQNEYNSTMISHTGGIHGYVTSFTTIPEKNLGVIILTNTDSNYLFEGMKIDILNALLDEPHRKISDQYHTYFEQTEQQDKKQREDWDAIVAQKNKPSVKLKHFEGTYTNKVYGDVYIKKENDDLILSFEHHKELKATLSYAENDAFLAVFNDVGYGVAMFPFSIKDNRVQQFTLTLDPNIEETTYDFSKQ